MLRSEAAQRRSRDAFAAAGVATFLGWTVLGRLYPASWQYRSADTMAWLGSELVCFNVALSAGFLRSRSPGGGSIPPFVRDLSVLLAVAHAIEARKPPAPERSTRHHRLHHAALTVAMAGFAGWAQRVTPSTATSWRGH